MDTTNIRSLSEEQLISLVGSLGEKKFRANQLAHWLYNRNATSFAEMDNIPQKFRDRLESVAHIDSFTEKEAHHSEDGTVKWLYETHDGHFIETVMIPSSSRNSICISTQVGCAMGCAFCRTARMGFIRNLETGEILEQFIRVKAFLEEQGKTLSNVIFMGMGEPLLNLENLELAIDWLYNDRYINLSRRRITISTSGIVPSIRALADRNIPAQLALSLNGSNQDVRSRIMPVARRYPLEEVLEAVDYYVQETGNHITFEFVLIKDITCTPEAANELKEIIKNRKCKVNAIVLNPGENKSLEQPNDAEVQEFMDIAMQADKVITIRQPRGRDIKAACGQLAVKKQKVS